jgi:hypothetical protein
MRAGWLLSTLLASQVVLAQEIRVVILEGDGALNNIKSERAKEPVVRVETSSGRPIEGAAVHFTVPSTGPGLLLDGGSTAITDSRGVAVGRGMRPNRTPGQFEIRVTASHEGQRASATLVQTNVEPIELDRKPSRKLALLAIIGGAAAGGAILAARAGGGGLPPSSQAAVVPTVTAPGLAITPGAPRFGAP